MAEDPHDSESLNEADLDLPLIDRVRRYWRNYLPENFEHMRQRGDLEESLEKLIDQYESLVSHSIGNGYEPHQASELHREVLFPPPEPGVDESEDLRLNPLGEPGPEDQEDIDFGAIMRQIFPNRSLVTDPPRPLRERADRTVQGEGESLPQTRPSEPPAGSTMGQLQRSREYRLWDDLSGRLTFDYALFTGIFPYVYRLGKLNHHQDVVMVMDAILLMAWLWWTWKIVRSAIPAIRTNASQVVRDATAPGSRVPVNPLKILWLIPLLWILAMIWPLPFQ